MILLGEIQMLLHHGVFGVVDQLLVENQNIGMLDHAEVQALIIQVTMVHLIVYITAHPLTHLLH
jgi:hypothetical protein